MKNSACKSFALALLLTCLPTYVKGEEQTHHTKTAAYRSYLFKKITFLFGSITSAATVYLLLLRAYAQKEAPGLLFVDKTFNTPLPPPLPACAPQPSFDLSTLDLSTPDRSSPSCSEGQEDTAIIPFSAEHVISRGLYAAAQLCHRIPFTPDQQKTIQTFVSHIVETRKIPDHKERFLSRIITDGCFQELCRAAGASTSKVKSKRPLSHFKEAVTTRLHKITSHKGCCSSTMLSATAPAEDSMLDAVLMFEKDKDLAPITALLNTAAQQQPKSSLLYVLAQEFVDDKQDKTLFLEEAVHCMLDEYGILKAEDDDASDLCLLYSTLSAALDQYNRTLRSHSYMMAINAAFIKLHTQTKKEAPYLQEQRKLETVRHALARRRCKVALQLEALRLYGTTPPTV